MNEEKYITECIESIIGFDYPREYLEVIFVDGMSCDNTIQIIKSFMDEYPCIRLLKNEKKIVPISMNIGIKSSIGDYICRLDAHAKYPTDYLSKLLEWSEKLNADNVGAVCKTEIKSEKNTAKAIQFVMSDKFGVGNSLFRIGIDEPLEVDTVPFGFYKKELARGISNNCFGSDSIFERIYDKNAWIIFLGTDMQSCTFVHRCEELANVPYRFYKKFSGHILGKKKKAIELLYYCRYKNKYKNYDNGNTDNSKLEKVLLKKKYLIKPFKEFDISGIKAVDLQSYLVNKLKKKPFYLLKENGK